MKPAPRATSRRSESSWPCLPSDCPSSPPASEFEQFSSSPLMEPSGDRGRLRAKNGATVPQIGSANSVTCRTARHHGPENRVPHPRPENSVQTRACPEIGPSGCRVSFILPSAFPALFRLCRRDCRQACLPRTCRLPVALRCRACAHGPPDPSPSVTKIPSAGAADSGALPGMPDAICCSDRATNSAASRQSGGRVCAAICASDAVPLPRRGRVPPHGRASSARQGTAGFEIVVVATGTGIVGGKQHGGDSAVAIPHLRR